MRYIQNFTDIDDKIIAAGLRDGIPPAEAARRYTEAYFRDMDALGVRRADEFTYVTEYIPQIIEMVEGLIERGHAYRDRWRCLLLCAQLPCLWAALRTRRGCDAGWSAH